jgi:hypothetical protein
MDEIINRLADQWPEMTLLAIILIKLFQSQLAVFVPQVVKDFFSNRAALKKDQQEHEQSIRRSEANLARLKEMSQLSSLSFTEEQLTQLTAETQVQLNEANSFIRQLASEKLDIIIEKLDMILAELRRQNGEKRNGFSNGTKKID